LAFVDDVPHCIDVSVEPDPARRALEQGARAEVLVDLAAPRVGKDASIMVRQPRGGLVVHISDHPADTTVSKPDPASKSLAMGVKPEEAFRDFLKAVRPGLYISHSKPRTRRTFPVIEWKWLA
jgi:hypothetical protein